MMKSEFISLLHEISPTHTEPTEEEYRRIEFVYNYHPSIGDKECIVKLWADFGNKIIEDMTPRAERVQEAEEDLRDARLVLDEKQRLYDALFE